jgi:nucleoside-diphosphate-sugar epimerase
MELTAQLLRLGYEVRGTVRDPSQSAKVAPLLALAGAEERLTLVRADLLAGHSDFVACVAGASVVFHTASPFATQGIDDPESQLVAPALRGTEHVVGAALVADSVRTVVLTSSIAATMSGVADKGGACFDESDWNVMSTMAGRPESGGGLDSYRYSKTVAERRFWEMIADPDLNPRGVAAAAVLPSFIVGPPRSGRTSGESATFMKMAMEGEVPYRGDTPMCDVRDVALAHIRASTRPGAASGRLPVAFKSKDLSPFRYIVSSQKKVQRGQVLRWLSAQYPHYAVASEPVKPASPTIFCPTNLGKIGMAQDDGGDVAEADPPGAVLSFRTPKSSILDMADAMVAKVKSVSPRPRAGEL